MKQDVNNHTLSFNNVASGLILLVRVAPAYKCNFYTILELKKSHLYPHFQFVPEGELPDPAMRRKRLR